MPDISTIEQIHSRLIPLANEEQKSAEWGEKIERDAKKFSVESSDATTSSIDALPAASDGGVDSVQNDEPSGVVPSDTGESEPVQAEAHRSFGDNLVVEVDTIPVSKPTTDSSPSSIEDLSADGASWEGISEERLASLNATLAQLPMDIKLKVAAILEDSSVPQTQVERLIDSLISNAPLETLSKIILDISGTPLQVDKRTRAPVVDTETAAKIIEEPGKANLAHIVLVALLSAVVLFGSWRVLYRPLSAYFLYSRALNFLENRSYDQADVLFGRAQSAHSTKRRYLHFAELLAYYGEDTRAAEYYTELLQRHSFDKKGALAYAKFEAYQRTDYSAARDILSQQIEEDAYNYDIIATLGDIYLLWGDEEDTAHYEDARYHYALLLDKYGTLAPSLGRMARYFIRTGNTQELNNVIPYIIENDAMPVEVYNDLLRYSVDNDLLSDLGTVIRNALEINPYSAELHYEAARYYERVDNRVAAEEALSNAAAIYNQYSPKTRRDHAVQILTHTLIGEDKFREQKFDESRAQFTRAIALYEEALQKNRVTPQRHYGAIYASLGDLYYFAYQDWSRAEGAYQQAESNRYLDGGIDYRQGYIKYNRLDYQGALLDFLDANERLYSNNIQYALANTLYNLERYASAVGYYNQIIADLRKRRAEIEQLSPALDSNHRALIEQLGATYNNAGAGYLNLHIRRPNSGHNGRGLLYLARGTTTLTNYQRENQDDQRAEVSDLLNLPYLNSYSWTHSSGEPLRIYTELPLDSTTLFIEFIPSGPRAAIQNDPQLLRTVSP